MTTSTVQIPIAINEAEAIIEPFWDERISRLREWQAEGEPGCNARASQFWCWCTLAWDHAPTDGSTVMRFSRAMDVDIQAYDTLVVRVGMPTHIRMTVTAVVDGAEQVAIRDEAGWSQQHEYEGPIHGRRLERLTIVLQTPLDQPDYCWLPWIMVTNAGRRAEMLARPKPYDAAWNGLIKPEPDAPLAPRYGFFFDAADLPAIRRRAHSPAYRPLVERMRQQAREAMEFHRTPEEQIGCDIGTGVTQLIQGRERDKDTRVFFNDGPTCALLGLIDEDPTLLRFAARIAMSLCHYDTWQIYFMQGYPGSTWDTRGFPESLVTGPLVMTMDWAGAYLTPNAEHLARYTITHKALGRIRGTFLQYEYMWHTNQSFYIMFGRLLGALYQQRDWPRAAADIDLCERDLYEMIDNYVQPDGSTSEGAAYWHHVTYNAMVALAALARYRGKPLAEMIPERIHGMWNAIAPLLSTARPGGSYLTTSDCAGEWFLWNTLALLAAGRVQGDWSGLLGARLASERNFWPLRAEMYSDGIFALIYGPDVPPAPRVSTPTFRRLETTGTVTSDRPWGKDSVHLYLLGQQAKADHAHADKGSFILEAAGDTFAGDRGITQYEDSQGGLALKSEHAHNLAQPDGVKQINPAPVAVLWQAEGDAQTLDAEVDLGAVWNAPVKAARRRIHSPRPDLIEIVDEFDLEEPRAIHWYLNTPLPIAAEGKQAVVQGKTARLTVTAEWADRVEAGEFYWDWSYTPYNRLVATSPAAKRHVLKTVLVLDVHPT